MKKAKCSDCAAAGDHSEKWIVYGWQHRSDPRRPTLCSYHNKIRLKNTKKPDYTLSKPRKPIKKVSFKRGEAENKDWIVNNSIWNSRKRKCVETGIILHAENGKRPPKFYFSHLMGKQAHPEHRWNPDNIVLHSWKAHQQWEFGDRYSMKTWKKYKEWMLNNGYKPVSE